MKRAASVEAYIKNHETWAPLLEKLRKVLVATELEETIKWGAPAYTLNGKIVVGMGAFKEYAGLWFHQGVFLSDPDKILINAQEGKTKALRQWRFASIREVKVAQVKEYVKEAIENQRQGKVVKADRNKPVTVPEELQAALTKRKLTEAFAALTKGKQREFADYIVQAKRAETKEKRIVKILPMIKAGVSMNDKYRNC